MSMYDAFFAVAARVLDLYAASKTSQFLANEKACCVTQPVLDQITVNGRLLFEDSLYMLKGVLH